MLCSTVYFYKLYDFWRKKNYEIHEKKSLRVNILWLQWLSIAQFVKASSLKKLTAKCNSLAANEVGKNVKKCLKM